MEKTVFALMKFNVAVGDSVTVFECHGAVTESVSETVSVSVSVTERDSVDDILKVKDATDPVTENEFVLREECDAVSGGL